MLYTVVGFYPDSEQRFCDHVEAATPVDAEEQALGVASSPLVIVATFEGALTPIDEESSIRYLT